MTRRIDPAGEQTYAGNRISARKIAAVKPRFAEPGLVLCLCAIRGAGSVECIDQRLCIEQTVTPRPAFIHKALLTQYEVQRFLPVEHTDLILHCIHGIAVLIKRQAGGLAGGDPLRQRIQIDLIGDAFAAAIFHIRTQDSRNLQLLRLRRDRIRRQQIDPCATEQDDSAQQIRFMAARSFGVDMDGE